MRVLYLTRSLTIPGGWERYACGLIEALARLGVEPVVVAVKPEPKLGLPFRPEEVALKWAEWGPRMLLTTPLNLARLRRLLKRIDLIHALVEPLAPLAGAAAAWSRRPFLVTVHGTFGVEPFVEGRGRRLAGLVFGRAAAAACVSAYTKKRLKAVCPTVKAEVVTNGCAPPAVAPAPFRVIDGDYFLTVGPLKTRKGQFQILEAFKALAERYPDLDWVVAGFSYDQAYPRAFEARVAELGLSGRVKILGPVEEPVLQRLYADCLFYALTPLDDGPAFEGFGLTYLEAGWHAKPSVGSLDSGAGESISHGVEGLLVPQGDVAALTEALERMVGEPGMRRAMGRAARRKAERMTWAAAAAGMMALYHKIAAG